MHLIPIMSQNVVEYEQNQFGTKATVVGEITPSDIGEMRRFLVQDLDLNYAKGWVGTDLSFLPELPWLKSLHVVHREIQTVEPIHCLRELRSLNVVTYCRTPIRLEQFPFLESFGLDPWRSGSESVFDCKTLKDLFIYSYTGKSSAPFKSLANLECLQLLNCSLQEIADFASLNKVLKMRLTYFRNLASLDGIEGMTGLEELTIAKARGVHSLTPLCALKHLRVVNLDSLGVLDTISGFDSAENLISFGMDETEIADGDLSVMLRLPQILFIGYPEKRHYRPRKSELRRELSKHSRYEVVVA